MRNANTVFKILPIAAAAFLVACGGNDTSSSVTEAAFASPAMIVPPGAASKSIPLTACNNGLLTATLVVNSSGDMILSGATNTIGPITELNRINYATASYQNVSAGNSSSGPSTYIRQENADGSIETNVYSTGNYFNSFKNTAPSHTYNCSLANGSASFALTTLPSSARLASQMLSGITGITTTNVVSGSFTGGVAYWDNFYSGYELDMGARAPDDASIRYFSLNMSTGAFGTSPTPNVAGTSAVISIPTTPTSTSAYFSESINNGTKSLYLNVDKGNAGNLTLDITRIGNLLQPYACANNYCD
jgi:hypothetical protein